MVGGAVRDKILGVKNKDVDFAVEAESYEEMKEDILAKGGIIFQERPEFFAIRARHPIHGGVDYTLCRKEGFYSDNRRPDSVEVGTIYDDLARRDFTVNAIAETEDGTLLDPYNGAADLKRMYLRCVGLTKDRLEEDPLRLLRAMRFHIVRGFKLSDDIEISFLLGYHIIKTLPIERVYEEVYKCFAHDSWATLSFLKKHSWLEYTIFNTMGLKLVPRITKAQ